MLYPYVLTLDASPKAVSGRTSYYQTRLAFHSLPQVIPRRCTTYGFGPPSVFRQTSPCSWVAHLASGLMHATNALFTLGFPPTPGSSPLVIRSIHKLAGSFFNRHAVEDLRPLRLLVDIWFQIYFTPLTGVLFTFPSRY